MCIYLRATEMVATSTISSRVSLSLLILLNNGPTLRCSYAVTLTLPEQRLIWRGRPQILAISCSHIKNGRCWINCLRTATSMRCGNSIPKQEVYTVGGLMLIRPDQGTLAGAWTTSLYRLGFEAP